MAVCCGQFMDSLHPESAPPSELSRCVPHLSSIPPSGVRGHSHSLLALTVVLVLIKYCTAGESTSSYTYVLSYWADTLCAVCVLLYSSTVFAFACVCHEWCLERGRVTLRLVSDLILSIITVQEHQDCQRS